MVAVSKRKRPQMDKMKFGGDAGENKKSITKRYF